MGADGFGVLSELVHQLLTAVARLVWTLFASPWFCVLGALVAMAAYAELR